MVETVDGVTDTAPGNGPDRLVAGGPDTQRLWPAWQVPAGAIREWVVLQAGIDELAVEGRSPVCVGDPAVWWPEGRSAAVLARQSEAVEWCQACPLLEACRAYALAAREREGVWGGLTAADRVELVRAWR
jgi:WhiB family redox-sensing transcriptional regulator